MEVFQLSKQHSTELKELFNTFLLLKQPSVTFCMLVLGQSGFHLSVDSNPLWIWCSFTILIVIGLEKPCATFKSERGRQLSSANRFSRASDRFLASPSFA